jgi:hypothetical protein
MGDRAATNEVIAAFLEISADNACSSPETTATAIEKIVTESKDMFDLKRDTVMKLSKHFARSKWSLRKEISPEKFVRAFFETKISCWIPIIKKVLIKQRCGIIVTQDAVVVYGNKEPVVISFRDEKFGEELRVFFGNWQEGSS